MKGQQKKSLNCITSGCYIAFAATLLAVGRRNPVIALAQTDATSVFFVALTFFAVQHQIMVWRTLFNAGTSPVVTHNGVLHTTMSMVAQAGQSSDWPVSDATGIPTPVWAIASERRNSSDSMFAKRRRLPLWLHPQKN
ncbi:TPA: ash family protein, partial [Salmonella enterica subsp. enterica serovar Welikade]|nr:ash family protein [Salmonella enterica subsp. enterica serovar Welikade]